MPLWLGRAVQPGPPRMGAVRGVGLASEMTRSTTNPAASRPSPSPTTTPASPPNSPTASAAPPRRVSSTPTARRGTRRRRLKPSRSPASTTCSTSCAAARRFHPRKRSCTSRAWSACCAACTTSWTPPCWPPTAGATSAPCPGRTRPRAPPGPRRCWSAWWPSTPAAPPRRLPAPSAGCAPTSRTRRAAPSAKPPPPRRRGATPPADGLLNQERLATIPRWEQPDLGMKMAENEAPPASQAPEAPPRRRHRPSGRPRARHRGPALARHPARAGARRRPAARRQPGPAAPAGHRGRLQGQRPLEKRPAPHPRHPGSPRPRPARGGGVAGVRGIAALLVYRVPMRAVALQGAVHRVCLSMPCGLSRKVSKNQNLVGFRRPVGELRQRGPPGAFDQFRLRKAACIHAGAAEADFTFAQDLAEHHLHVVVTLGNFLPGLGATHGIGQSGTGGPADPPGWPAWPARRRAL
jgi:hypothetical protein